MESRKDHQQEEILAAVLEYERYPHVCLLLGEHDQLQPDHVGAAMRLIAGRMRQSFEGAPGLIISGWRNEATEDNTAGMLPGPHVPWLQQLQPLRPSFRVLELRNLKLEAADIAALCAALPTLEELVLNCCTFEARAVQAMSGARALQRLALRWCTPSLDEAVLAALTELLLQPAPAMLRTVDLGSDVPATRWLRQKVCDVQGVLRRRGMAGRSIAIEELFGWWLV